MELEKYSDKRNFTNTPEPAPTEHISNKDNLLFVVQFHQARATHYDFRLEHNGVLLSWAVPKGVPELKQYRLAIPTEPHPYEYAFFEGTIPQGNYGAGTVAMFDRGQYIQFNDFDKGLKEGHLLFELKGKICKGIYQLDRIKNEANWILKKRG